MDKLLVVFVFISQIYFALNHFILILFWQILYFDKIKWFLLNKSKFFGIMIFYSFYIGLFKLNLFALMKNKLQIYLFRKPLRSKYIIDIA